MREQTSGERFLCVLRAGKWAGRRAGERVNGRPDDRGDGHVHVPCMHTHGGAGGLGEQGRYAGEQATHSNQILSLRTHSDKFSQPPLFYPFSATHHPCYSRIYHTSPTSPFMSSRQKNQERRKRSSNHFLGALRFLQGGSEVCKELLRVPVRHQIKPTFNQEKPQPCATVAVRAWFGPAPHIRGAHTHAVPAVIRLTS